MRFLLIVLLFCCCTGYGQEFAAVDKKVQNYPEFTDINTLAIRIQNDFSQPADRARAVYIWITENISYNLAAYYATLNRIPSPPKDPTPDLKAERERKERVAQSVFQRRITLCEGYSSLFQELAERVGLEARMIKGVTKTGARDIGKNRRLKDHIWNAVLVDAQWQLIDPTWAAGIEDAQTKSWVRQRNDFFFFTPPDIFLTSHFPERQAWQLVPQPASLEAFYSWPVFYPGYFEYGLRLEGQVPRDASYFQQQNPGHRFCEFIGE